MKFFYLLLIILSLFLVSCESEETPYKPEQSKLNETCVYDTDCEGNTFCNKEYKICSKINIASIQQCTHNSECYDDTNTSLCDDKTKPCKCSLGRCSTYDSCENNLCSTLYPNEYKSKCEATVSEPFYQCICDDNYIDKSGVCRYECSEFGETNDTNDGCNCSLNYIFENGQCVFDCSDIENSHANENNNACDCNTGFIASGNSCILDCSTVENSHPSNDNTKCDCNTDYFPSLGFCCQEYATYNAATQSCKCNSDYHSEGNICVIDTVCSSNPCLQENEQCIEDSEETNGYTCECNTGYHETGNICCQVYYHSEVVQSVEQCISDYKFCNNDGDCSGGDICTINKEEGNLLTYCSSQNTGENIKLPGVYCRANETCSSNTCIKYDDDDDDETNGYDGYCAKVCQAGIAGNPCDNSTCSSCTVDTEFNTPICTCSGSEKIMGNTCKQIAVSQGNKCGEGSELIIDSPGIYQTSNKVSDGYTNNYVASCNSRSENNDTVFRLNISSDSIVTIETLTELDTVLYLKETCNGEDIACADDIVPSQVFRSKLTKFLYTGSYYLFVDSVLGDYDINKNIEFRVIILGTDECPRGTSCINKELTKEEVTKEFYICKPKEKDSEIITKCYIDEDCSNGKLCSYNPLGDTNSDDITLGCITDTTTCSPKFEPNFSNTNYCCSGLDLSGTCIGYCNSTLDCRVATTCNTFTVGTDYTSQLDGTKACLSQDENVCTKNTDCPTNKPYCTIKDNGDGRLYSECVQNLDYTNNIGASCNSGAYKNCYNNACFIPTQGINPNTTNKAVTPYCTSACEYYTSCPSGYTCEDTTIIYPIGGMANDAVCKETSDVNCLSYTMKMCVQNKKICEDSNNCSNTETCMIDTESRGVYFYCEENPTGTLGKAEACNTDSDCKTGLCYDSDLGDDTNEKYCTTSCKYDCNETEFGTGSCQEKTFSYHGTNTQKICVKP